ncbi:MULTISPECIES: hypothetical protein [Dyella]|uniref:Lipoprotein n=2 Tax=Dyella TaxID=231454 RepID=A0A4R0YRV2_9GAMM|nr:MULTISPECIES: hypothetical protein [Dyella]TBR40372.1 hypothetical protein EYV96_09485 [Dyella terrae]TCI12045.1 hypothetical protein EZM97_01385 [Dyella soli]
MKTPYLLAALGATALLAACSSRDPSKRHFTQAIDAHFQKHCLEVNPTTHDFNDADSYPATFTLNGDDTDGGAWMVASYEALVKAGMLAVQDGVTQGIWGERPNKTYSLTAAGRVALKGQGKYDTNRFCAGHLETTEIVMFTTPAVSNGMTVSQVTFTAKAVDVPAWAMRKDLGDAMPEAVRWRDPVGKRQLILVLTNEGWLVDGDQTL